VWTHSKISNTHTQTDTHSHTDTHTHRYTRARTYIAYVQYVYLIVYLRSRHLILLLTLLHYKDDNVVLFKKTIKADFI